VFDLSVEWFRMSERIDTATVHSEPPDISSRWLDLVRDGLSGRHHDYTQGSVHRAIALLAIPMVLELALESLFAVVDIFFVSRLGADAVATVGFT
jgi:hypothetical protein